ncbi:unnamed protein product, partial [Chrysoparadoxa australica]
GIPTPAECRRPKMGLLCCWLLVYLLASARASNAASPQGYDQTITLFSPEGRLHQIEYTQQAVDLYGAPCVLIQGKNCCVAACMRPMPDTLVDPATTCSTFTITPEIELVCVGLRSDVLYQAKRVLQQALEFQHLNGYAIPPALLARRLADIAQVYTQHAARRALGCVSLLLSHEEAYGTRIYRVDPSGQSYQVWATAAGRNSASSTSWLESAWEGEKGLPEGPSESIQRALHALHASKEGG